MLKLSEYSKQQLRRQSQGRMEAMRGYRLSWWAHWASLAEVYLPRRYRWFVTPNQYNRGSQINTSIIDETGVIAARTCSAGMMSGLTSPTRPWFRLGFHDYSVPDFGPVRVWLDDVEKRMTRVFAESNFYQSLGVLYHDNVVFGSSAMIIYEDAADVIRCYNPYLGEFFFGASARLDIDSLAREFVLTIQQAYEMFGLDNLSESTQQAFRSGGPALEREIVICHLVEPNFPMYEGNVVSMSVPKSFPYREIYWEQATAGIIQARGFMDRPFVAGRWDTTSNDPYGRSPGMDALPAVRQLQVQQRRKAEAIDKMVRPPMLGSVSMKNEPASILPGAITYATDIGPNAGFRPAFQIPNIPLTEMVEDIGEVQNRVKTIFFVDLFMMISQLDTVRTATEIDARREEKLIQLGPVIERFENEVLDPIIDRVFAIMTRRGLIPPPPQEIQGMALKVEYVSMLAEAQRAASTTSLERLLAFAGTLVGVDQNILDNINLDEAVDEYADLLGVSPRVIRPMKEVLAIRAQKARALQAQQQAAAAAQMAESAKTMSQTDVGGGQNALQMMIGGGGPANA